MALEIQREKCSINIFFEQHVFLLQDLQGILQLLALEPFSSKVLA